jgi:hypothetical protein
MPDTARYSLEQITRFKSQAVDQRRHLYYIIPILVTVILWAVHANGWLDFLAIAGAVVGAGVYSKPRSIVTKYTQANNAWNALLKRSDPKATIPVEFTLKPSEEVYYADLCKRYEERRTGQVIDTQSRTKNAVGSAVLGGVLFGPAGAIVGGSMARKQTTGTATDVYDVVPVDHGNIAITSARFVFMGARDTIEIPTERIMRYSAVEGSNRIAVEYSGRAPGESYEVNPSLFNLCMARRARDRRFSIPIPPPPLSTDVNQAIEIDDAVPALLTG